MNVLFRSYCIYLVNKHLLITGCCSRLPQWFSSQESGCSAGDSGDMGLIPRLGRSPEEGMATYSSIITWRIPWTEEPSGLLSKGSQRVRHNWSDLAPTLMLFQVPWLWWRIRQIWHLSSWNSLHEKSKYRPRETSHQGLRSLKTLLILHLPQDIKKREKLGYRSKRENHPADIASSFCFIQPLIHQHIHWKLCEIYGFLHKMG